MRQLKILCILFLLVFVSGCASTSTNQRLLDSDESQLELRSIQSRAFDTTDKERVLRSVMATLQDLGFVIDKADMELGMVTATKLNRYALRMTITVRPRGETQMLVRANAQFGLNVVDQPEPYQEFFAALQKSMFLAAQQVE